MALHVKGMHEKNNTTFLYLLLDVETLPFTLILKLCSESPEHYVPPHSFPTSPKY